MSNDEEGGQSLESHKERFLLMLSEALMKG